MIKVCNISKEFISESGVKCLAVEGASFMVEKNEFISIVGESGSGKSTLLSMMGLIEIPTKGYIELDGVRTGDMTEKELSSLRNSQMGFIFQNYYLEHTYSVFENIEVPMVIAGIEKGERNQRIRQVAEQVNISNLLKKKPGELSGGEQQRVSIARALVNCPVILLADEPCGNLDSKNGQMIMDLFRELVVSGITVILVTHNHEHAAMTDRLIRMKDGRIVADERI
ncbi:MAG: ABC transporter ATP-binding protein [Lachnospiraceae bacterium]|nr:ABC transporter ATP-binding protein [Lachnospiraceae bacterium]